MTTPQPQSKSSIHLELGDIIRFNTDDPSNKTFHHIPLYIDYIDEYKMRVISTETRQHFTFAMENNRLVGPQEHDTVITIKQVHLLSRSPARGYARQHGLLENTWIEVHIRVSPGSPLFILTGKIVSLKEDQISVQVVSAPMEFGTVDRLLYIDFKYRGIPENLHIEQILIMEGTPEKSPVSPELFESASLIPLEDLEEITEEEISTTEQQLDADASMYLDAQIQKVDDIVFEPIMQTRGVSKSTMRYSLENQISNMLDEILADLPPEQRTKKVMERIYLGIQRYIELRREFSIFEDGVISRAKRTSPFTRPFKEFIQHNPLVWANFAVYLERELFPDSIDLNISRMKDVRRLVSADESANTNDIYFARTNTDLKDSTIRQPNSADVFVKYDNTQFGMSAMSLDEKIEYIDLNKTVERVRLAPGKEFSVASLLLLPREFQEYNRSSLPSTNILMRALYSDMVLYPFLFASVIPKHVSSLNADKAWMQMLSGKHPKYRSIEIRPSVPDMDTFLSQSVPKTLDIIRFVRESMPYHVQTTLRKCIEYLEPYGITMKDATYSMREFIYSKCIGHIQYLIRKTRRDIQEHNKKQRRQSNYVAENQLLNDYLSDFGSALFSKMMYDNIMLFNDAGPRNPEDEAMQTKQKEKAELGGMPLVVKEYSSEEELKLDNGKMELVCDAQFDDTPYFLKDMIPLEDEEEDTPDEAKYKEYLREVLTFQYDCGEMVSDKLLDAVVSGKKVVQTDELAVIPLAGGKYAYYKYGANHEWKFFKSSDMSPRIPVKPDPKENKWLDKCTEKLIEKRTENFLKKVAENNPNIKYEDILDRYNVLKQRNKSLDRYLREISDEYQKRKELRSAFQIEQRLKYNNIATKYSAEERALIKQQEMEGTRVIQSPHLPLVYFIQSIDDLQNRSECIRNFKAKFCREAIPPEDKYWYYCKDTSAKLLPTCIYELALASHTTTAYRTAMNRICRNQGILNEDGNAFIDKHSGFFLRKIDDVEDVQFDDHDRVIFAAAPLEKEDKDEDEAAVKVDARDAIYVEILKRFQAVLGFDKDTSVDTQFVIRFAREIVEKYTNVYNDLNTEAKYRAYFIEKKQDLSKQLSFETFMKLIHITMISIMLLIGVQTAIPRVSFKLDKTNAKNCVQKCIGILDAFPFVSDETKTASIQCMLCVSQVVAKSFRINGMFPEPVFKDYLKKIMRLRETHNVLELELRYRISREYSQVMAPWGLSSSVNAVSAENAIIESGILRHPATRWPDFAPPLIPFMVDNPDTNAACNVHGSTRMLTYYIIQKIQEIVRKKTPLLSTLSNVPFLQNACCNDGSSMITPLQYFNTENAFDNAVKCCVKISGLKRKHEFMSKPPVFYYTGSHSIMEEPTVLKMTLKYSAIFHYAQFHTNRLPNYLLPLKDKLQKPDGYVPTDSVELNISRASEILLKNHNAIFEEVMKIIRLRGQINVSAPSPTEDVSEEPNVDIWSNMSGAERNAFFERHTAYMNSTVIKSFFESVHPSQNDAANARGKFLEKIDELTLGITPERVRFLQNCIYLMTRLIPAVVCSTNGNLITAENIEKMMPEHWDLFSYHKRQIWNSVLQEWSTVFSKYANSMESGARGDVDIAELMTEVGEEEEEDGTNFLAKCNSVYNKFVVAPPQDYDIVDLHELMKFGLFQVIDLYIKLSCSQSDKFKWCLKQGEKYNELDEYVLDKNLNTTVYNMLHEIIDHLLQVNSMVMVDYSTIRRKMMKIIQAEKKTVTDKFKNMSNDDRRVLNMFKKYKLEEWNVTDINKYGSKTFRDGTEVAGLAQQTDTLNGREQVAMENETLLGGAEMFEEHE